ncbi:MAG: hypothetical protein ACTSUF_11245 [Candidatus Heimdallarchaeaceae archaeon]
MDKNKRILIATLNQGTTDIELTDVLVKLSNNPYYQVGMIYPCDKPTYSNRNKIVQKFLQSDFDYLLMIDDDVIPPMNILELADFQKDIISAVCFSFQQNMNVPLTLKQSKEGDYNVDMFKGYEGLVETDAVGTGCLMLSRKVLEDIQAPFNDIIDEDGIRKFGHDVAFCKKAKEKGYKVYCNLNYSCQHKVTFDLKKLYSTLMQITRK